MKQTILIIEDNEDLLELEEFHLSSAGYDVMGFLSTKGVEKALEEEDIQLLIVDRNLPGAEGSEFVQKLRQDGYDMPVIFVTAKDSQSDVEEGFLRGGDDYLTKPFNMKELVLRVKARLARYVGNIQKVKYKELLLDINSSKAFVGGVEIKLTSLEFRLLEYLIKNRNQVVSRDKLIEEVWQEDIGYKSVNMAISRLKHKLEANEQYIEAIRGVGYKIC
jgi:DNA-binding response OmpR family regulator